MIFALDTSVIVGALDDGAPDHAACRRVLLEDKPAIYSHALSEAFSTFTGGRLGFRLPASQAAVLLRDSVSPRLEIISLTSAELLCAYTECEVRGVRGGAIYDFLHLVAARKAGAECLYTLNLKDFQSIHRPGDPIIAHP